MSALRSFAHPDGPPDEKESCASLQDVAAQVLILDDIGELFVHVSGVHLDVFLFQVGRFKRKLIEHFFQNSMQPPRADIFR